MGKIKDGSKIIDQVTIGCEAPDTFAINCHGNPLIIEQIMQLLQQQGVELITTEQMLCKTSPENNAITLEAKLALPKVKTIEGTKIILNQIDSGLTEAVKNWLENPSDTIAAEAKKIIGCSDLLTADLEAYKILLLYKSKSGTNDLNKNPYDNKFFKHFLKIISEKN